MAKAFIAVERKDDGVIIMAVFAEYNDACRYVDELTTPDNPAVFDVYEREIY
jgi:hypothetical protein